MSTLARDKKASLILFASAATAISLALFALYKANRRNKEGTQRAATNRERTTMGAPAGEKEVVASNSVPPMRLTLAPATSGSKALVVCSEGSEEALVAAGWASESSGLGAAVTVCPPGFLASHAKTTANSYDFVVVERGSEAAGKGEATTTVGDALGQVLKLLKPKGKIALAPHDGDSTSKSTTAVALKRELTFAGFVSIEQSVEDSRVILGERPAWEVGASAPVRLSFAKKKTVGENGAAEVRSSDGGISNGSGQNKEVPKTWKLSLDGDGGLGNGGEMEDDDLVDEDALLEASAPVVKRATESEAGGCATKRRACKDCSCGRAEMEAAGDGADPTPAVVTLDNMDDVVTSACGNCSKGDAFRCGGCPFLGKPAFEKGQEKLIMLADLDNQQDE